MPSAELLQALRETTIASSAAMTVALLLRRPMRAWFGARVAYALWWIVPAAIVAVLLPAMKATVPAPVLALMPAASALQGNAAATAMTDRAGWLVAAWLIGAFVMAAGFVRQQRSFVRGLGRLSLRADGMHQAQAIAGLPAATGLWNPRVVVPADFDQRYAAEERVLMRDHELAHIRHGDLHCNAFTALLRCAFWFNPLLHYAVRHFRHDQELACDQRVIARHPDARRHYGEAMFKTQLAVQPLPLGCHWGFSHPLKERIAMLGQPLPTRRRWLIGSVCAFVLSLAFGYAAWAAQPASVDADIPLGSIRVTAALSIDDCAPQVTTFLTKSGAPLLITHSQDGHDWVVKATVAPARDPQGLLTFSATIQQDGKPVASPQIMVRNGEPGVIQVGKDRTAVGGGFEGVKLEVTLTQAVAEAGRPAATVQPAAANANADAGQKLDAPVFPPAALAQKLNGTVVLLIDMDVEGRVTAVTVDQSEPAGVFDAAAVEAAWHWQFNPQRENGKVVPGRVRVPIWFDASGHANAEVAPRG